MHGSVYLILFAAFLFLGVYRRVRRSVGLQLAKSDYLGFRIVIYVALGITVAVSMAVRPQLLVYAAVGLAAGALTGFISLRFTQFEWRDAKLFFRSNSWLGMGIIILFLVRIVVVFVSTPGAMEGVPVKQPATAPGHSALATYVNDPATAVILFILVGYYVVYYSAILWRKHVTRQA